MDQLIETHYAVNLIDYFTAVRGSPFHPYKLLLEKVLRIHDQVECEARRVDGTSIPVRRDIPQERWNAIVELIRKGMGQCEPRSKHMFRIYESKTGKGSWKRI